MSDFVEDSLSLEIQHSIGGGGSAVCVVFCIVITCDSVIVIHVIAVINSM